MTPRIGVQLLIGQNPEPFLEAAIRSVMWADYFVVVNTAPRSTSGEANEALVRKVVPSERLAMVYPIFRNGFSFSEARNTGLGETRHGDYLLLLDSDMVHWWEFETIARTMAAMDVPVAAALFWHHCVYKNLWHSVQHREILFKVTPQLSWHDTEGGVHEVPSVTRDHDPLLMLHGLRKDANGDPVKYHFHHYGYIKPPAEVSKRWEFYRSLGATIHDYDVEQPDHALDDWPRVCQIFTGEHPDAVRELLEDYPSAPLDVFRGRDPRVSDRPRVGLVMLTWDDAENLRRCLHTLEYTTEPFELMIVDNGSTDGTMDLVHEYMSVDASIDATVRPGLSLTQALNYGFGCFLGLHHDLVGNRDHDLDYIGWIHPDMSFEWWNWLTELRVGLDEHPEIVKLGATPAGEPRELRPANSQCYLVRRTALEEVGLFDEDFEACGGYEDWEHNFRLLKLGMVGLWPGAMVRHESMSTRRRHDNQQAALNNAERYYQKTGSRDPFV